jgi:phenylacetic acid degradation operon negative regulatory protein
MHPLAPRAHWTRGPDRGQAPAVRHRAGRDWDGDWLVLVTTVPEHHRNLRHRLRTALGWAGFDSMAPGVWISPHPSHAPEVRQVLASLGEPVHGTLLRARLDNPAERHRVVH